MEFAEVRENGCVLGGASPRAHPRTRRRESAGALIAAPRFGLGRAPDSVNGALTLGANRLKLPLSRVLNRYRFHTNRSPCQRIPRTAGSIALTRALAGATISREGEPRTARMRRRQKERQRDLPCPLYSRARNKCNTRYDRRCAFRPFADFTSNRIPS